MTIYKDPINYVRHDHLLVSKLRHLCRCHFSLFPQAFHRKTNLTNPFLVLSRQPAKYLIIKKGLTKNNKEVFVKHVKAPTALRFEGVLII